ncbi:MAG TPA: hypothetical protein VM778_06580 [Gemmatimonadota bacterium]|nr:hypothetical protein [Gemmatimonadota bacterium]
MGECLAPGARYVWFVRGYRAGGQATPWSAGRLFEITALPSPTAVAEALAVLRRYLAAVDEDVVEGLGTPERADAERPLRTGVDGEEKSLTASATVVSAVAAIRGRLGTTTGEVYGVVGITDSAGGAGVAAENTAAGPDLTLVGDPSALVHEGGISRSSASDLFFDLANPGAGSMTLRVDGVSVLTETDGVTGVLAGDGLTGGGTSGDVTLAADFGGTGAATTLARSDHDHFAESWSGTALDGLVVTTDQTGGRAVRGVATAPSGFGSAIDGWTDSTSGRGVAGFAGATTGVNTGVYGATASSQGQGVFGQAFADSGFDYGVRGETNSTQGHGVLGHAFATSGLNYGVRGQTSSTEGRGVYGLATAASGDTYGVYARTESSSGTGVFGLATSESGSTYGVFGHTVSPGGRAVYGLAEGTGAYGVYGRADDGTGVYGQSLSGFAGFFAGDVSVQGDLTVTGTKSFKIDHPLDPASRYLLHFNLESDETLNFYNGNVVLDGAGEAWVVLPQWLPAINRDFRYQLTPVGGPAPNLYVASELHGNRFQIAGGPPGLKVSWTLTAVRDDPWVRDHAPQVEVEKRGAELGKYLYPAGYGQPKELGLQWQAHQEAERAREATRRLEGESGPPDEE